MLRLIIIIVFFLAHHTQVQADATQISAGLDGRAQSMDSLWGTGEKSLNLHGAFINLRHVISDAKGDRYIFVAQLDADDNMGELEAYQVYAQLKGSLGGANLRVGRYILPFGLLANLDTERQLLQTQESIALGIKLDTGIQVFGFAGALDYALSVSQGSGTLDDQDSNKLLVARIGIQQEENSWGISYLDGRINTDNSDFFQQGNSDKQRLAIDAELDLLPWMLRIQFDTGKDDGRSVSGATLLADYDVNARLSFNSKISYWDSVDEFEEMAIGLSYQLPNNFVFRLAETWQQLNDVDDTIFSLQLYWDFSHAL
jgi:hypothetical protein